MRAEEDPPTPYFGHVPRKGPRHKHPKTPPTSHHILSLPFPHTMVPPSRYQHSLRSAASSDPMLLSPGPPHLQPFSIPLPSLAPALPPPAPATPTPRACLTVLTSLRALQVLTLLALLLLRLQLSHRLPPLILTYLSLPTIVAFVALAWAALFGHLFAKSTNTAKAPKGVKTAFIASAVLIEVSITVGFGFAAAVMHAAVDLVCFDAEVALLVELLYGGEKETCGMLRAGFGLAVVEVLLFAFSGMVVAVGGVGRRGGGGGERIIV